MLYSKNGNYPTTIPFRIVLSNGNTRTDPSSFTPEELADVGYIAVDDQPSYTTNQVLSWDPQTVSWLVRDKTTEEIEADINSAKYNKWVEVRAERDKLLSKIDWKILRYQSQTRLGVAPIDNINSLDTYAQQLRDITLQENPFNIVWPVELTQE